MALPIHDHPLPPELALDDEPLTSEVLDRLDEAFAHADADGTTGPDAWQAMFLDPDSPDAPSAAALIPEDARRWTITDDGAAEWSMRHVAQLDTELVALIEQRDGMAARIDRWFDQRADTLSHRRAFFAAHLIRYGAERRAADPKAPKTLALPSGRITSTDQKPKVKVLDDDAVAAWLVEHDLAVGPDGADIAVTTTKVYVVPLRKVLQPAGSGLVVVPTGEVLTAEQIPAGITVEDGHTTFDVKPIIG